jgi:transposase
MRENYPSDKRLEQFEKIRFFFPTFRKQTRPRTVDLYDVFCAILYVLKTACQWRMLPSDFPSLRTVYEYFRIWSNRKDGENQSLLEALLTEIVGDLRLIDGRQQKTSFVIIAALGVKNSDTAEEKGYDGGKKVSGIKRHIAVDTQGLPHAIHITTANITDREGALEAFEGASSSLSNVVNVLADGGYTGETFASKVKEIIGADVEIAKRS